MSNEQNGVLLRAQSWEMTNEETGEVMTGTTITLGMKGDPRKGVKGFDVVKLSSRDPSLVERVDEKLVGKSVSVPCDLKMLSGGRAKFIPLEVKPA